MHKFLGMLAFVIVTVLVIVNVASACWMFLSIAEMEEQAGLIVIAELTGDLRGITRDDGTGITFWSLSVEHVLKGESGSILEVATGGHVTTKPGPTVMLSTDYRLDRYGELFLLYLHNEDEEGVYWPVTPRAVVRLERSEGGAILGAYEVVSEQHTEEHDQILDSVSRLPSQKPQASVPVISADVNAGREGKQTVLALLGVLMVASIGGLAVKKNLY